VEFACGARNVDAAWGAALAVLDALDDARGLATLGTIGRLGRVHFTLTTCNFGNLGHGVFLLLGGVSAHTHQVRGFNGAVDTAKNGTRLALASLQQRDLVPLLRDGFDCRSSDKSGGFAKALSVVISPAIYYLCMNGHALLSVSVVILKDLVFIAILVVWGYAR